LSAPLVPTECTNVLSERLPTVAVGKRGFVTISCHVRLNDEQMAQPSARKVWAKGYGKQKQQSVPKRCVAALASPRPARPSPPQSPFRATAATEIVTQSPEPETGASAWSLATRAPKTSFFFGGESKLGRDSREHCGIQYCDRILSLGLPEGRRISNNLGVL